MSGCTAGVYGLGIFGPRERLRGLGSIGIFDIAVRGLVVVLLKRFRV